MNEQILEKLAEQAGAAFYADTILVNGKDADDLMRKFAELIVEECRTVVTEVYRNIPLELCRPLLTADEEIAKHFYGVKE